MGNLDNKISECIAKLNSAKEATESASAVRYRLEEVIKELERFESLNEDDSDLLLGKIGESIKLFEIEHPRITNILNELMVTLTGMGI